MTIFGFISQKLENLDCSDKHRLTVQIDMPLVLQENPLEAGEHHHRREILVYRPSMEQSDIVTMDSQKVPTTLECLLGTLQLHTGNCDLIPTVLRTVPKI